MGYEIIYYYQEKNEKGYDENIKTFKKRLGDPYEEFPLKELSRSILLQLARRDIYVKNLEVYEITKKKIKYKETKNGIILKNKKYLLSEEGFDLVVENDENNVNLQEKDDNHLKPTPTSVQAQIQPLQAKGRVIKRMNFVPEPQQQIDLLKKGVKLTQDRVYDIHNIEPHPNGVNEVYTLIDDKGKTVKVSDLYFIPVTNLIGQDDEDEGEFKEDNSLNWSGVIQDNIPSIRRGV